MATGSVYNFKCDEGFIPVGPYKDNLELVCMENGSYSLDENELPFCAEGCKNPDPIANGSYVESLTNEYVTSDQLTYTCDAGFSKTSSSRVIKYDSGERTPSPPVCLRENSATRQCSVDYEFFFTDNLGNYSASRQECLSKGADLFHENFGFEPHGDRYHAYLQNFTYFDSYAKTHYWVGVTDLETEGVWRFVDGTEYVWTKPSLSFSAGTFENQTTCKV